MLWKNILLDRKNKMLAIIGITLYVLQTRMFCICYKNATGYINYNYHDLHVV